MIKKNKLLLLLALVYLFSCDTVGLEPKDVLKYDWLNPFVIALDESSFDGTHDIDSGILKFNYKLKNDNSILKKMDSIALSEKWNIAKKTVSSRFYTKILPLYESSSEKVIIKVNVKNNIVYFNVD